MHMTDIHVLGQLHVSRRRWLKGALLLAGSGVLAACSQAAPATSPATPTASGGAPKPAAQATSAPAVISKTAGASEKTDAVSGGTWSMPIVGDPIMNPVVAQGRESNHVNAVIFNQLVRPDKVTLQPSPDLATNWEVAPDGLTWTFLLRQGVRWHDGQPLTADDVKFTFDRIIDTNTNTRLRGDLSSIKEVQVVDPSTVKFVLKQPFSPLPVFLGYTAGIVPKHLLEKQDINAAPDFNKKAPVGTGPFKIKEYVAGSHVAVTANPEYFRGRPKLDGIVFKILPDANTTIAQLNTGELAFGQVEPWTMKGVDGNPGLDVVPTNQMAWWHLSPNTTNPLFSDKRVRQAMALGIDRQAISDGIAQGKFPLVASPVPDFLKEWHDPDVKPFPFDPDRARQLLADVGWKAGADGILRKDGQPFTFVLSWGRIPGREEIGTLVHQYLKKLGMDVTVAASEWSAFIKKFQERDFDVSLDRWIAPYDPDLYSYFHSSATKAGKNASQYANPELDKILEQGRQEGNLATRKQIYKQMQAMLSDEQPQVFLLFHPDIQARSQRFGGIPKIALGLGDPLYYADEFYGVK
jgi:peptide/nickel transport system substrate-binding protein